VEPDFEVRRPEYRAVPGESVVNAGGHALTDSFFRASGVYLYRLGITEGDADLGSLVALGPNFLGPAGVGLGQVQPGIDQEVDAVFCAARRGSGPELA
jgi:hypothetical protein